ncbi:MULTISPECIES: hypothetical protein [unclassified Acetobacterium]|uniref:hypothetical protein n=1 Tax=unclassified Acetobacterium TaxID=2638182 RepID=UPI000DBEB1EA|nr:MULTISPECIES: hypothetical protein [unclassified Acetobacterium]AWW27732.1 hypothetical protein DOZ58_14440 [Acetobacterium sp. KB-1]MDZ5725940.1 hypothetical protein [Acetobacterium sp. K1/6]
MQTIFYIIILIISLVSSFKICGLLKVMIWGENTLDLGMKILSFWAMIFFFCLLFWVTVFVYLGIPLLIIGVVVLVASLIFGGKSDEAAVSDEDEAKESEE